MLQFNTTPMLCLLACIKPEILIPDMAMVSDPIVWGYLVPVICPRVGFVVTDRLNISPVN